MDIISYIGIENNIINITIDFEEEIDSLEDIVNNTKLDTLFSLTIS